MPPCTTQSDEGVELPYTHFERCVLVYYVQSRSKHRNILLCPAVFIYLTAKAVRDDHERRMRPCTNRTHSLKPLKKAFNRETVQHYMVVYSKDLLS